MSFDFSCSFPLFELMLVLIAFTLLVTDDCSYVLERDTIKDAIFFSFLMLKETDFDNVNLMVPHVFQSSNSYLESSIFSHFFQPGESTIPSKTSDLQFTSSEIQNFSHQISPFWTHLFLMSLLPVKLENILRLYEFANSNLKDEL